MKDKPNRLRQLRKAMNISQEKLAEKLNVTQAMISNYEKYGNIPIDVLITLARIFDVSVDYLIKASDEEYGRRCWNLTESEYNLVSLYRKLSLGQRKKVDKVVTLLSSEQDG